MFRFSIQKKKKFKRMLQSGDDSVPEANLLNAKSEEPRQSTTATESVPNHEELFNILKEYGLNRNIFFETIQGVTSPEDAINYAVETYKKDVRKGKRTSNPAGYILGIIRHYDPQAAAIAKNHVQAVDGMSDENKAGYEEICLNIQKYGNIDGEKSENILPENNLTDEELMNMSDEEVLTHCNRLSKVDQIMFKISLKIRFQERYDRLFK